MSHTLLITGKGGMLGSAFAAADLKAKKIFCPSSSVLDITDFEAVKSFIGKERPDIIIHCAAHTDVEKGETDKETAYHINTIGTANLVNATLLLEKEPVFCFISSTGIYGNHKSKPYNEFDDIRPTTVHHKSKFEAEKIVAAHIKKHLIVRTGWLFGGDKTQPKNFVYKRYIEASKSNAIQANASQIGNPTFVDDVVSQVAYLLQKECFGVYNCVNGGVSSRYEYVKKIVELFGLDCTVSIASEDSFKRVAPVSLNESATNYKLELMGLNIMPTWEESLAAYVEKLKKELS
jgi:dTDP-4-dehydrorhamnose reductase